jgi:dTDP-4-amino-4,6-dideoxygalactose transaminase
MKIKLNDFTKLWELTSADLHKALDKVGQSGHWILGENVKRFEAALAQHWGIGHAVGVASGLDALEIALRVLDLKPGEEVLTTPYSAFATTLAILRAGGKPVFVDTDLNGLIDLDLAADYLSKNRKCKFMIPVDLFGLLPDLNQLKSLQDKFAVKIIEDAAQAIGSLSHGRPAGVDFDFATTSFYPTKNLGCIGDGGAVLTNNATHAEKVMRLRDYGQSEKYRHSEYGMNSRLDELQAAFLADAFLPRLSEWTERRSVIAARYLQALTKVSTQVLRPLKVEKHARPVWHLFPLFVGLTHKAAFQEHLTKRNISFAFHYPTTLPDQPVMKGRDFKISGELKNAMQLTQTEVSLPIHPFMTEAEVSQVCAALEEFRT